MKRIFILFAITLTSLVCCMTLHAENKEAEKSLLSFLEQYENQEGVEIVNLKGLLLNFAKPARIGDTSFMNCFFRASSISV